MTRRNGGGRRRRSETNYKPSRLRQCFAVSDRPTNPIVGGKAACHVCGKPVAVRGGVLVHHQGAQP